MEKITVRPVFVEKTKNVRNFTVMMDGLALGEGEGRFGMVYGRAGRGKSRTCQWYHGHHDSIYLRMLKIWAKSDIEFLKDLARELGVMNPPHRRGICFREIIDRLIVDPRPIFLDEIERLPQAIMEICRDITDLTCAPIILIGEEELVSYMKQNRRVWSRTYRALEFLQITRADIVSYIKEATGGVTIDNGVSGILHDSAGGDFRLVRRDVLNLVQIANAKGTREITEDMVKIAVKSGLSGR